MGRTLTLERQKLKQDAIRLRQELGWSERQIAKHLNINCSTIHYWVLNNSTPNVLNNLSLNQVILQLALDETLQVSRCGEIYQNSGVKLGSIPNFTEADYRQYRKLQKLPDICESYNRGMREMENSKKRLDGLMSEVQGRYPGIKELGVNHDAVN